MEDHFSVNLPAVVSPGQSVNSLVKDFKGKVHKVKDAAGLASVDLDPQGMNLIVVTLNPLHGSQNEEETVAGNGKKG